MFLLYIYLHIPTFTTILQNIYLPTHNNMFLLFLTTVLFNTQYNTYIPPLSLIFLFTLPPSERKREMKSLLIFFRSFSSLLSLSLFPFLHTLSTHLLFSSSLSLLSLLPISFYLITLPIFSVLLISLFLSLTPQNTKPSLLSGILRTRV